MHSKDEIKDLSPDEKIIKRALDFFKLADSVESNNRSDAIDDIKFAMGEQWQATIYQSRQLEARPTLTLNKLEPFIRQVTNNQRQQRPRIKVHGVNDAADKRMADVLAGLCRHIEVNSNADDAYDIAYDSAVRMGWGYWRVTHDYVREDSFEQEIYIKPITNPFMVHFDPYSTALDGSDAECVMISEMVKKTDFEDMYPSAEPNNWDISMGESVADWVNKEEVRIAEFFYTEYEKQKLLYLIDGSTVWEDEYKTLQNPLTVLKIRDSARKVIKWCKLTSDKVLEKKVWAGRFIPIVPVYGMQAIIDGETKRYGIVRNAKDSQRMYNYWMSSVTESIALAPKAKWLIAEGSDEGHEKDWESANLSNQAALRYKTTDSDGNPIPQIPQRIAPEPPPDSLLTAAQIVSQDIQAIVGVFDATQQETGNQSGKALLGQQSQMDLNNFHYYDNLTKSIRHTGMILLDLIPKIYDTQRVMRIIGADGRPSQVTINEQEEATGKILNDVSVGRYDVVMETGPSFNTRRLEFVNSVLPLMQDNEQLFQMAGDLFFRNLDFPSSETIADRLAANNPLSQIDENSEIPPQVQMAIKKLQGENQQQKEQLQAYELMFKHRQDMEQVKQAAETERTHMEMESRAYDRQSRHETDLFKAEIGAQVALDVAQMNNDTKLREHGLSTAQLGHEVTRDHRELDILQQQAQAKIHEKQNPKIK